MAENFDRSYTPILWDCLGFRFKDDAVLFKINNITKVQRPLVKTIPNSKTKFHLVYNPLCMAALVMKVTAKDEKTVSIDEIYPSSFSGRVPIYDACLDKIDGDKFCFTIYNDDSAILQTQVLLPPDQYKLLNFMNNDGKIVEIKENCHYNLFYYLLTPLVNIYPDLDSLKASLQDRDDVYSDVTESRNITQKETINIAGQIYGCKIVLNRYTGRRFLEIEFIYNNTRFIVYTPTVMIDKLPKRNQYIFCRHCVALGEASPANKITSKAEKPVTENNPPVLEFDVEYLYGYDNTIKFKKDNAFDGDIKIEYINIRLFEDVIKIESAVFKNATDRQDLFLAKDGDYKSEIEELKTLDFQENREPPENLIEGRYWFVRYNDKYIEGFENTPSIIEDIKRIVNFDEIIDVIKSRYKPPRKNKSK